MKSKLLTLGLAVATMLAVGVAGVAAVEYTDGTDVHTDEEVDKKFSADELETIDGDDADFEVEQNEEVDKKFSADELETIDGDDADFEVEHNEYDEKLSADQGTMINLDESEIRSDDDGVYLIERNESADETATDK